MCGVGAFLVVFLAGWGADADRVLRIRIAGYKCTGLERCVRFDQRGTASQITRIQHAGDRNVHEIAIAEVEVAVLKCKPHGVNHDVQRVLFTETKALGFVADGELLQHLQLLQCGDAAAGDRWHGRHRVATVGARHGLANGDVVVGQVSQAHFPACTRSQGGARSAGCGASSLGRDDGGSDLAFVEPVRSLGGDESEGLGQVGVFEQAALGQGHAARSEQRGCFWLQVGGGEAAVAGVQDVGGQHGAHGVSVFGQGDGGVECLGQGVGAPVGQHRADGFQRARHTNGNARHRCILKTQIAEHGGRCGSRRFFTSVDGDHALFLGDVGDDEGATAYARALRLDHVQCKLNGGRGVKGIAAGGQYIGPYFGGQWVRHSYHAARVTRGSG